MGQSVIDNWFLAFEQALLSSAERIEPRETRLLSRVARAWRLPIFPKWRTCRQTNWFPLIQQAARDEWANTLWANLDVSVLSDGIDGFIKQLKRLPREVKALPLCHILEEKMKEFKNSIPLFSDLKNEALRERSVTQFTWPLYILFDFQPCLLKAMSRKTLWSNFQLVKVVFNKTVVLTKFSLGNHNILKTF